jgi:uncharacterized membrane protein
VPTVSAEVLPGGVGRDLVADRPDGASGPQDRAPRLRTETFSDGVFAIAITILVLEIHEPTQGDVVRSGGLLAALLDGWPSYLSYLATFLTIGTLWLSHHAVFEKIAFVDRTMQWLNLLLLLGVAFIPFPNALIADHLADGPFSEEARTATAVYALVAAVSGIPWIFLWRHLERHTDLLEVGYSYRYARSESRRPLVGVLAYGAAFALALFVPLASIVLFIVVAVFFALTVNGATDRTAESGPRR